jgi:hypothetical protein
MYISDVERRAKGRKLTQQGETKRVPKAAVRKVLEGSICGLDRVMNELDTIVEDYWTDDQGKPLTKGLPAKNFTSQAADQLYQAKVALYRAIKLLENAGGNSAAATE